MSRPMKLTPMLEQYFEIKRQVPDAILFYRLGDFYEMFFEDAEKAAPLLDLVLTARNKGQEHEAPMCGVPYHSADGYIAKLIRHGLRVAICDQTEEASATKGLVRRGIGLEGDDPRIGAAGAALRYASASHKRPLDHVLSLRVDNEADFLQLDAATLANLEILDSRDASRPRASLWSVVNATRSAMGGRMLRQWLTRPLKVREAIFSGRVNHCRSIRP